MLLHVLFLSAMATNWEEYIQGLNMQLSDLVSSMFIAKVIGI
jgi:hypothetical protein